MKLYKHKLIINSIVRKQFVGDLSIWTLSKNPHTLYNIEKQMLQICKLNQVPVPKIINQEDSRSTLHMSLCRGTKLKNRQSEEVYYKLGQYLKQLHSVKINADLRHQLPVVELNQYISFFESKQLDCTLLKKNKPNNVYSNPCLIHGNLHTSNIIVSDNDISGLIDLEEGAIAHPEFDLASIIKDIISINYGNFNYECNQICNSYINSFIEGYGTQLEVSYLRQWSRFLKYRDLCIFEYKNKKNI